VDSIKLQLLIPLLNRLINAAEIAPLKRMALAPHGLMMAAILAI
jgi:hypothetical protein